MIPIGMMSLPIFIFIFPLLLLLIYRENLHKKYKKHMINKVKELELAADEDVLIISVSYDDKYFKEIEQLLSKIKYKTIVFLKAPDWLIKIYCEKYSNHIVRGVNNAPRFSYLYMFDGTKVKTIFFPFHYLYKICVSGGEINGRGQV